MLYFFRRLAKARSLRLINLVGLTLVFTCLFISYRYLERELSFDKFYTNSARIARLSLSFEGKQADGRLYGGAYDPMLKQCPEIEDILKFTKVLTMTLTVKDNNEKHVVNDILITSGNFFSFFDLPFIEGSLPSAFDSRGKIVISEKLAKQLFGRTDIVGEKIELNGRRYSINEGFIGGVYKDVPENSHFHSDIIIYDAEVEKDNLYYSYLLLKDNTDTKILSDKITDKIRSEFDEPIMKTAIADIMPLTDIHLHSRVLRELEPNGNMNYVYMVGGANILLLIIVMFNLWLNSNVIFAYHKRYYQLLRFNGASSFDIIKDEGRMALIIGLLSLVFSMLISYYIFAGFGLSGNFIWSMDSILLSIFLLCLIVFISLIPVAKSMALTVFGNSGLDLRSLRFSFTNVRYMLVVQYAIVIFIIIVAVSIRGQISVIKTTQVGAENDSILVLKEQSQEVIDNYFLLKQELLKHPEIEMVTGAMQLPGDAVRDGIQVKKENSDNIISCPVLVVGEDFFPFFNIKTITGTLPSPLSLTLKEEYQLLMDKWNGKDTKTEVRDNYIINRSALKLFGYSSSDEAIGKELFIEHSSLDNIPSGRICGVVDDFVYSNVFEEATPMLIIQRSMYMNCFMLRLSPDKTKEALAVLEEAWSKVNPDFPLSYSFLQDSYKSIYRNELNAEKIVNLFSGLCLIITLLGLIVFMAFMIKSRTKEIGIRKVNGASAGDIVLLLNKSLLVWIFLAFVIAVPLSVYVMSEWLNHFVYKAKLYWWIFVGSGLFVVLISVLAISMQSRKAANINPIDSLKQE